MEDYWDLTDIIYDVPGREASINPWKFYDEKTGLFAGFSHTRLVEPIKLARYRHEYSLIGLKTGDVNFSWTQEMTGENRSAGERSDYTVDLSGSDVQYNILLPTGSSLHTVAITTPDLDQESVIQVLADDESVAYTVTQLEGKEMLIILSETDLSGQILEIRTTRSINISGSGLLFDTHNIAEGKSIDWTLSETAQFTSELEVSPNPFIDNFNVTLSSEFTGTATAQIFDATGRLISTDYWNIEKGQNRNIMQIDGLNPGLFILKVEMGDERFVKRIIKN